MAEYIEKSRSRFFTPRGKPNYFPGTALAFERQENRCSDQWTNRGLTAVYLSLFQIFQGSLECLCEMGTVCAGLSVIVSPILYLQHCNDTFFLPLSQVKQSCFSLGSFAHAEFSSGNLCCSSFRAYLDYHLLDEAHWGHIATCQPHTYTS